MLFALALALTQNASEAAPLGIYQSTIGELREPAAVAFTANGRLVVVEAHADRVSVFDASGARVASFGHTGNGDGELLDPRGVAVSDAGNEVFVADSGNHRVVVFGLGGQFRGSFGSYGSAPGELRDPRGVAVAAQVVAVADTGNDRVQLFATSGEPLRVLEDGFVRPTDVAFDADGNLHVVDSGNHRVVSFEHASTRSNSFGDFGPHPGFFASPQGIACQAGELFVVDGDNHRVQVFDTHGARHYEWGLHALRPREGEGHLHYPSDVAISRDGSRAAVAEPFEDRVQIFRRTNAGEQLPDNTTVDRTVVAHFGPTLAIAGDLLAINEPGAPAVLVYDVEHDVQPWEPVNITRWTAWGRSFGRLLGPTDAALDFEHKELYIADAGNATLLQLAYAHDRASELAYDPFLLKLVRSLDFAKLDELGGKLRPTALAVHPSGDVYVVDQEARTIVAFSRELALKRAYRFEQLHCERPVALAFAPGGQTFFVVDELGAQVHELALDGAQIATLGARGEGDGQFVRPRGIAVAGDGAIFVSDVARACVQRFGKGNSFELRFGSPGLGAAQFHKPCGLALDASGRLFVLDWGNHRGQVFTRDGQFVSAFGSRLFVLPTREKH